MGYKLAGIPGAIAAALGTVFPTTVLMLIMVIFFYGIKDSQAVQAMLKAVRPAVVGMLLWTAYDMAYAVWGVKNLGLPSAISHGWDKALFALVAFAVLTFTKINPAIIVVVTASLGFLLYR